MATTAPFYSLIIFLVFVMSACDAGDTKPSSQDLMETEIDKMFDFSNLDAPPPPYEGPTTCLYKVRTTDSLITDAKSRETLFDNGMTPCTWVEDALEVQYTPTGGFFTPRGSLGDALFPSDWSCPKPTDPMFDGLIVTDPEEVPSFDLPIGCYGVQTYRTHAYDYFDRRKVEPGTLVCFRIKGFGDGSEDLPAGLTPAQHASWVIQSWQYEFGFPVRHLVVSGDQIEVMLNRQFPALGADWGELLFRWLVDLNFKPSLVQCPEIDQP